MARRKSVNVTGISHLPDVVRDDLWIFYSCVNCGKSNFINIGRHMITPEEALETANWKCEYCGFEHKKDANLPERYNVNWEETLLKNESIACKRFWKNFFIISTGLPDYYWKRCQACGRVLPASSFSHHNNWGELEKQAECRACKSAINAIGNPKRTAEQHAEAAARRRIGDLMHPDPDYRPFSDIDDLFERFGGKCFLTGVPLDKNDRSKWQIDHILPASYYYPLTKENACLLSKGANGNKRAQWPSEMYTPEQLMELARITGADINLLSSPEPIYNENADPNMAVVRYLDKARQDRKKFNKRVQELRKILIADNLVDSLTDDNKRMLGLD